MKKKIFIAVIAVVCIGCFIIGASSETLIKQIKAELRPDFSVFVDGEERVFKNADGEVVHPVLYDGTTYLPLRAIGELMGKVVYWFEDDKRVELRESKTTVTDADVIIASGETENVTVKEKDKAKDEKIINENAKISLDEAKKIALEKAALKEAEVVFTEARLDNDDGRMVYEIEFKKGTTEYSAEISGESGKITEWDVDIFDD